MRAESVDYSSYLLYDLTLCAVSWVSRCNFTYVILFHSDFSLHTKAPEFQLLIDLAPATVLISSHVALRSRGGICDLDLCPRSAGACFRLHPWPMRGAVFAKKQKSRNKRQMCLNASDTT